jgi:glutamate carboxypeptidase
MPFNDLNKIAFEKIKKVGESLGIEIKAGGTGGMSDANFVAPLGIPVIDGMGAVGEGYHSEREFMFADSLEERTKLLAALLSNWE